MESRKLKENSVDSVDTTPPVCPVHEKPTDHSSSERTLACCDRIDLRLWVWSWPTAAKGMERNDSSTDRRNQTQAHADADAKATEGCRTVLTPVLRGIKLSKRSFRPYSASVNSAPVLDHADGTARLYCQWHTYCEFNCATDSNRTAAILYGL